MFFTFFQFCLINAIAVAAGFAIALLLRDNYLAAHRRQEPEEPVLPLMGQAEPEPSAAAESEEPPLEEPELTIPNEPSSAAANLHGKVDEFDESQIPKRFKVETILENMKTSGVSDPNPEETPDFSSTPQAAESFSAAPDAFEMSDEDEIPSRALSSSSEPLLNIDVVEQAEDTNDPGRVDGVSSLARKVLGEDYDFGSFAEKPQTVTEESAEQQEFSEAAETGEDAELRKNGERSEAAEQDEYAHQRETTLPQDTIPERQSANERIVAPLFHEEMIDTSLIEQDYSPNLVFTEDSPPMLPKRKASVRREA